MKTRTEILRALAQDEDDRLLLARLLDRLDASENYPVSTRFLSPRERTLAEDAIRLAGAAPRCAFFGGWADAERTVALLFPSWMDEDSAVADAPIALLRAEKSPADTLTHRDYLGSLMGLQIDRAMVGDILVHDTGADIFVLRESADFLLLHFDRVGRRRITLSEVSLSEVRCAEAMELTGEGAVSSLRLDCIAALVFGLSRAQAQEYIAHGQVSLNGRVCLKPSQEAAVGDRLTVRGKGRARVSELGGVSRKGRQFIRFTRSAP